MVSLDFYQPTNEATASMRLDRASSRLPGTSRRANSRQRTKGQPHQKPEAVRVGSPGAMSASALSVRAKRPSLHLSLRRYSPIRLDRDDCASSNDGAPHE